MKNPHDPLTPKQRGPREAADMGAFLTRAFFVPLVLFFGLPFLFFVGLFSLFIFWGMGWLTLLLLWYLKPLWERFILIPASQLIFKPQIPLGELWKKMKIIFHPSLWADLTIRRFSPQRSYMMGAKLLENLRGKVQSTRLQQLARQSLGPTSALTVVFFMLELAMFLSWLPICLLVDPNFLSELFSGNFGPGGFLTITAVYALTLLIVEPLYTLGGFALYLNRRTILEGWDIHLSFTKLAKRIKPAGLILVVFFMVPGWNSQAISEDQWSESAKKILAGPDFNQERQVLNWRPNQEDQDPKQGDQVSINSIPSEILLGVLVGAGVLTAAGFFISFLIRKKRRGNRNPVSSPADGGNSPASHNEPVQPQEILRLWAQGEKHAAVTHLFQAGLKVGAELLKIEIPPSATEEDCLVSLKKNIPESTPLLEILHAILHLRIQETYGRQEILDADFMSLVSALSPYWGTK